MFKMLFFSAICCLALYGLSRIILYLLYNFVLENSKILKSPYTVLCVKNQADSIETTIRSLAWHIMSQNRSREVNDIIIVDLGSTDETFDILICLAREYEFIHPMSKERYIELVGSM